MPSKLFQYAAIWEPSAEQIKSGEKAKLIVDLKTVLCTDDKSAMVLAARDIPTEFLGQLDQVQVVVRPF